MSSRERVDVKDYRNSKKTSNNDIPILFCEKGPLEPGLRKNNVC